jgi:hypothetical protein
MDLEPPGVIMKKKRHLVAATLWLSTVSGLAVSAEAATRVAVVDDATGRAVPARAYLWHGDDPILPPGYSSYERGDERHFLVPGEFTLDLGPGRYRLRVERGLEYLPVEVELDVPHDGVVPVRLRRWIDMNREGWYSADMHVHRDPADIALILGAEDLNFVPTITTHVWSTDVSQPWTWPSEFPVTVEPNRFFIANAQEVERIQGGPGAVILLGEGLPLPFSGYELHPPAIRYTRATHAMGGFVEGDKPFWVDTLVNATLGELDFIELNCNHFLPRLVDTDLAPWSHWPIEFGYRGNRGFALWMMDLYYRILGSGTELALSAGSANGVKATPVGYDRVYVRPVADRMDYPSFIHALARGRSFSTNGPILELEVDGRAGPGDRIDIQPGQEVRLRARARSRGVLDVLELIVNGDVVAERSGQGARELVLEKAVRLDRSSWAAARVFEKPGRSEVFAHTSPVYFFLDGRPVIVPEAVQDLIQKTDLLIRHTERVEGFREEADREETLGVYREARDLLRQRLLDDRRRPHGR